MVAGDKMPASYTSGPDRTMRSEMETVLQTVQFKNLDLLAKLLPMPVNVIGTFDDDDDDRIVVLVYEECLEKAA